MKGVIKLGNKDHVNFKHGDSYLNSGLYNVWRHMKKRCYNPNFSKYKYYGGRGISVCDEWKRSYLSFKTWALSNGYDKALELDRKENDGNYCPDNCRFVTKLVNMNNRSSNVYLEAFGIRKRPNDWAKILNVSAKNILQRKNLLKWDDERILLIPLGGKIKYPTPLTKVEFLKKISEWEEINQVGDAP